MTDKSYIFTADLILTEPDGTNSRDGEDVYRTFRTRKTWSASSSQTVGEIMNLIDKTYSHVMNVRVLQITVTEDASGSNLPW